MAGGNCPGAHAWPTILSMGGGTRHPGHLAWKPLLCELPPEAEGTEQAGVYSAGERWQEGGRAASSRTRGVFFSFDF